MTDPLTRAAFLCLFGAHGADADMSVRVDFKNGLFTLYNMHI
jgi:hypothetical protein